MKVYNQKTLFANDRIFSVKIVYPQLWSYARILHFGDRVEIFMKDKLVKNQQKITSLYVPVTLYPVNKSDAWYLAYHMPRWHCHGQLWYVKKSYYSWHSYQNRVSTSSKVGVRLLPRSYFRIRQTKVTLKESSRTYQTVGSRSVDRPRLWSKVNHHSWSMMKFRLLYVNKFWILDEDF